MGNSSLFGSRRIIVAFFVAAFIVAGGVYIGERSGPDDGMKSEVAGAIAEIPPVAPRGAASVDTDGDGLPDWEEYLYGSNVYFPDTDGDGDTDADEVRLKRDPTKPGPDDALAILDSPDFATSADDALGIKKEFYAKFLAERGNEVRESTYQGLIKGFRPQEFEMSYKLLDLNVISDNSPDVIRAYANEFGNIIEKYTQNWNARNEKDIMYEGLEEKDPDVLEELELPVINYRNLSNDLRRIRVPSGIAEAHLAIVNGYDIMSRGLLAVSRSYSDPIQSAGGYQAYTTHSIRITLGYADVVYFLHATGVEFTPEEKGYYFRWRVPPEDDMSVATTTTP